MTSNGRGLLISTETNEQVEWNSLVADSLTLAAATYVSPAKSKHPSIATNAKGTVLVAWAEGAGWGKGGQLKWKLFGTDGTELSSIREDFDLPTWSFPISISAGGNDFIVLY